jgi:hypothetical protein
MVSRGLDLTCFGVIVEYNTSQQEQELAMHRKLIHSVRALGITLSLLTAGLILAVPASAPGPHAVGKTATPTTVEVTANANANAARSYNRHRRAQAQDAMALPFFSFAQGLRRGNRS